MNDEETRAVAFLDMSGFTALTEVHGDHSAARLAQGFTRLARELLAPDDRFIKSIGDAVLFTSPTAGGALASLGRIVDATHRAGPYPVLRAGVHHGPIVHTDGDVFGVTVNVAARLAAIAGPGQTLGTRAVAAAAQNAAISVTNLGPIRLRNVTEPVCVYAVGLDSDCHCGQVDPVCRMRLPSTAAATRTHKGNEYRFCSQICEQRFATRPELFADVGQRA